MLVHIHVLIYVNIIQIAPNVYLCTFQPGIYTTIISIYILLVYGLVPPLFLTIFGLWTVKNVRQLRPAVVPTHQLNSGVTGVARAHTIQSKDRQLIRMLLTDIIVYIVLRTPFAIYYIYQQITQYQVKSDEQVMIEQLVQSVASFSLRIPFSISSYTYLIVSKTFVQKSKVLLQEVEHFALLKRHLLGSCCQNVVLFRVALIDLLFESMSCYKTGLLINKNRNILASTHTLMVVSYIVFKSYQKILHAFHF